MTEWNIRLQDITGCTLKQRQWRFGKTQMHKEILLLHDPHKAEMLKINEE
jgi:hypothetical protein